MNKLNIILPPIVLAGFWSIIEVMVIPFHPELTNILNLILWLALTAYVFFHRLDYLASASAIIALAVENISYIYFTETVKHSLIVFLGIYAIFIFYFAVGVITYLKKSEETLKFKVLPPEPIKSQPVLEIKSPMEECEDRMSEDQKYEKRIKESNVRPIKELRETVERTLEEFPPTGSIVTNVGKEETFASHQNNEDIKKKLREKYLKD